MAESMCHQVWPSFAILKRRLIFVLKRHQLRSKLVQGVVDGIFVQRQPFLLFLNRVSFIFIILLAFGQSCARITILKN